MTLLLPSAAGAAPPTREILTLRGRAQSLRLYGSRGGPVAVVASGDGGWIHLGPSVAEFLASQGYFVVGFDSKAYLSSFTRRNETLSAADVPRDFAVLLDFAARAAPAAPVLIGISEGAGLSVLAATDPAFKPKVAGILALGLPDQNELGWRLRDSIIYVTKGTPNEPLFSAAELIGKVSPLPIAEIHSSGDEFVPLSELERVMARALAPKRLQLIQARDHRFSGGELQLNRAILDALEWIEAQRR